MEKARGGPKPADKAADAFEASSGLPPFFTADSAAVTPAPVVEQRPDKFFAKFSETTATTLGDAKPEAANAPAAKSSKFAKLFNSSQPVENRGYTEPPTPATGLPPPANGSGLGDVPASDADKQAFAALLSKLHLPSKQQSTPTPPNANAYSQPPPPPQPPSSQSQNVPQDPIRSLESAFGQRASLGSPDPPLSYGLGRPEEPRLRSVPPPRPEIMAPRPMQPSTQPPTVRHDQMLQDLVASRHNAQSQGSGRADLGTDQHSAYLMQLMQRRIPDQPVRPIESIMRQPQPQRQVPMHHFEPEPNVFVVRDHGPAQQRQMRPPAGFEDQFRRSEGEGRMMQLQPQPPHILQRQQIPPGLDQGIPPQQLWPGQQPPPVQRQGPMIQPPMQPGGRAPPGLSFGPAMGNGPVMGNLPPNMLPSGDSIPGLPRGMPPPGFYTGGPPPPGPGFMPPPGMGGPFPGPEGFFPPGPFDGRGGMPPPGGAPFRR